jgi:hypothetical protein
VRAREAGDGDAAFRQRDTLRRGNDGQLSAERSRERRGERSEAEVIGATTLGCAASGHRLLEAVSGDRAYSFQDQFAPVRIAPQISAHCVLEARVLQEALELGGDEVSNRLFGIKHLLRELLASVDEREDVFDIFRAQEVPAASVLEGFELRASLRGIGRRSGSERMFHPVARGAPHSRELVDTSDFRNR